MKYFAVFLPDALLEAVRAEARGRNVTLQSWVAHALAQELKMELSCLKAKAPSEPVIPTERAFRQEEPPMETTEPMHLSAAVVRAITSHAEEHKVSFNRSAEELLRRYLGMLPPSWKPTVGRPTKSQEQPRVMRVTVSRELHRAWWTSKPEAYRTLNNMAETVSML